MVHYEHSGLNNILKKLMYDSSFNVIISLIFNLLLSFKLCIFSNTLFNFIIYVDLLCKPPCVMVENIHICSAHIMKSITFERCASIYT